jgi:hypothetical protein
MVGVGRGRKMIWMKENNRRREKSSEENRELKTLEWTTCND